MDRQYFDVVVIGGGIIGCVLTWELAKHGCQVALLEKERDVALHTSGRNSGVVHAGFNAKPGTLKARLCVQGNEAIRRFAHEHRIPYEQVGTWVVATEENDLGVLNALKRQGDQNGVPGLELVEARDMLRAEPHSRGLLALYAPTGGIIDSAHLTRVVANDAQRHGAVLCCGQRVLGIREHSHEVELVTPTHRFGAALIINCAGLFADRLAHTMGVGRAYRIVPFRGSYFSIRRAGPPIVNSMLYSVPPPQLPFLGVHLTRTVHGTVLVGPDAMPAMGPEAYAASLRNLHEFCSLVSRRVIWKMMYRYRRVLVSQWGPRLWQRKRRYFCQAANRLVRGLQEQELVCDARVGIRPQLVHTSGELVEDLLVERTERSLHVLNTVSPGMTCALAFAQWLADGVRGSFIDAAVTA